LSGLAALATVFVLAAGGADGRTINTLREIGPALGRCWSPPADLGQGEITVLLSLKRDGSINGRPRITFVRGPDEPTRVDIARSLSSALSACGPLPVSPGLGAAIAGRVFTIRFVNKGQGGHDA
jgi:hypothetical protein